MSNGLEVQSYNVVVITQPVGDVTGLPSTVDDLDRIVSNPTIVPVAPDHLRVISPRDQMALDFRPQQASLTDLSGQLPARALFEDSLGELVDFFKLRSVPVSAYGWNIEVLLRGLDVRELLAPLLQADRIDKLLAQDTSAILRASAIEFEVSRPVDASASDRMAVRLGDATNAAGDALGSNLSANWHFDRSPPPPSSQGGQFAQQIQRTISQLTGPREGEH